MIPEETIKQVAAAIDLVELIGRDITLKKTGVRYTGLCPFHAEKTPSFIVTPARQRFRCFGCGVAGDVFDYISLAGSMSFLDAVRYLATRAGISIMGETTDAVPFASAKSRPKLLPVPEPERVFRLPRDIHQGSRAELRALAERRGLSVDGIERASDCGSLSFGQVCGFPSWIVLDQTGGSAQGRRMDGRQYPSTEHLGARKAHTLKGSRAAWPIGTKVASDASVIVLCEGGPDLLAAYHFILAEGRNRDVAAVAMLGCANDIHEEALLLLANKRIRVYPHLDDSGIAAAVRWTAQLERVGCDVDAFSFDGLLKADGVSVKDLNDLAMVDADCFEAERGDLEGILPQ